MFYQVRKDLNTAWFNFRTKAILETPPAFCIPDSQVIFVTQICHRDVYMYLLAIKSLARFVSPRKIFALDDGSLTKTDKTILYANCTSIEILPISEVKNKKCPQGGCWERILFISELVNTQYVIQVDSDTLTLNKPIEVLRCIKNKRSFTLGTNFGDKLVPMKDASQAAKQFKKNGNTHIQVISETCLDKLPNYEHRKYVRGNAGFTGFARHSFTREEVENISVHMNELVWQNRWKEWGSEQVMSNIIIANSPNSVVLPLDEYSYYHPTHDISSSSFLHFIGTYRFNKGAYIRLSQTIIQQLQNN